jgi:hypothetical protein
MTINKEHGSPEAAAPELTARLNGKGSLDNTGGMTFTPGKGATISSTGTRWELAYLESRTTREQQASRGCLA